MYLKRLKLKNFRNYQSGEIELPDGLSIITGANAAGKTSLLEAASYAICGSSFRTSKETEMIGVAGAAAKAAAAVNDRSVSQQDDERFLRLEADLDHLGTSLSRAVSLQPGSPARIDSGGGPRWLPAGSVLCFSPDDLALIKGAPALRRRFIDDAIARQHPAYQKTVLDYQKVLAQRNSFLQRARAGIVPLAEITPWDRQLAQLALQVFAARREHCEALEPAFASAWRAVAGEEAALGIAHLSPVEAVSEAGDAEAAMIRLLRDRWSADLERVTTGVGTHRDDFEFMLEGRSLRAFGSQGEQRTTVLALLLGERELAACQGGARPLFLLDDVMSELDPGRRRRLMALLTGAAAGGAREAAAPRYGGQALITAADESLFSREELENAAVFAVAGGRVRRERAGQHV